MKDIANQLIKLQDLSNFLEKGNLEDNLVQLTKMAANILDAENCSIMLLNDGEPKNPRMKVCANYGFLPKAAYEESTGINEGIAGHVISTGTSLLIEDINKSEFINQARRKNDLHKSLLCTPIKINKLIIGVINVSSRPNEERFTLSDLNLLEAVALFIGKSIQAIQLQKILDSRFAQLALAKETQINIDNSSDILLHHPNQVAKILARSFYRELSKMGLDSSQIIIAASEIITQLNNNVKLYSKRIEKKDRNLESRQ